MQVVYSCCPFDADTLSFFPRFFILHFRHVDKPCFLSLRQLVFFHPNPTQQQVKNKHFLLSGVKINRVKLKPKSMQESPVESAFNLLYKRTKTVYDPKIQINLGRRCILSPIINHVGLADKPDQTTCKTESQQWLCRKKNVQSLLTSCLPPTTSVGGFCWISLAYWPGSERNLNLEHLMFWH